MKLILTYDPRSDEPWKLAELPVSANDPFENIYPDFYPTIDQALEAAASMIGQPVRIAVLQAASEFGESPPSSI